MPNIGEIQCENYYFFLISMTTRFQLIPFSLKTFIVFVCSYFKRLAQASLEIFNQYFLVTKLPKNEILHLIENIFRILRQASWLNHCGVRDPKQHLTQCAHALEKETKALYNTKLISVGHTAS